MILLSTSFGDIIKIILGLICLPVMFYMFRVFYGYIFGFFARVSGKRIVRHGRTIATPDTIDILNQDVKDKKDQAVRILNTAYTVAKNKIANAKSKNIETLLIDKTKDKISKLKELDELRKSGVLTSEEFELVKKEVLKS